MYGVTAITALTAQNTVSVQGVLAATPESVRAQIDAVASDIAIHAAKTGMLATAPIVDAVADALRRWAFPHVVVDPVMVAKSGDTLLDPAAVERIRLAMLPLASVVTPNRPEAEVLTGYRIVTAEDSRAAARRLVGMGARAVVIKGGHFDGPELTDLLFDGEAFHEYRHARQQTRHTHGTGCTFSAALAANLALGVLLPEAVARTADYVAGAIAHGLAIGHGHGPLDHFYR